jgi:hypothetical protein
MSEVKEFVEDSVDKIKGGTKKSADKAKGEGEEAKAAADYT